jgi:hypothetical protein
VKNEKRIGQQTNKDERKTQRRNKTLVEVFSSHLLFLLLKADGREEAPWGIRNQLGPYLKVEQNLIPYTSWSIKQRV